tara:strand:- start:12 stop:284 length:273 start_codon:yes stop_codon:yes gene_type:complete
MKTILNQTALFAVYLASQSFTLDAEADSEPNFTSTEELSLDEQFFRLYSLAYENISSLSLPEVPKLELLDQLDLASDIESIHALLHQLED